MKGGKDFQKMQKKNKFPPGFVVAAVGLSGILFMTGCAGEYDVLYKVADSTTVGESITDKINDMVSDQSQNVTYICKRMKTLSGEVESEEDSERPEYNPETYADTSKADISKFKAKKVSVSDDEVDDYIKSLMREARIYGDETDAIDEECIAHVAYVKTDTDTKEEIQNLSNMEWSFDSSFFPEEVSKKLIGCKVGDNVKVKCSGCEYDITVNDINSVNITNMTVFTLTSGQYMKASNYRTFIKNYLYNQKVLSANEDSIDKLCKSVSVTGYPEDVLSYDIQQKFMYYYQITGASSPDDETFKFYIKENLGCKTTKEFTTKIQKEAEQSLDDEIKILALAKKYNLWLDDDKLAAEVMQNTTEYSSAEDYYAAYSKSYARYFISKFNLAKEIQKNEERIEGAG